MLQTKSMQRKAVLRTSTQTLPKPLRLEHSSSKAQQYPKNPED